MRHTISILVDNQPGVLSRVSGLFSGRGFNIESLSVAETLDPTVSRMTIVTRGNDQILEQITKQLNKLVNVIKVLDFTEGDFVEREMALIKVKVDDATRSEILGIVDIFRGKVVDVYPTSYTVEITGDEEKIRAIIDLFLPMGVLEVARTGKAALSRGSKKEKTVKKEKQDESETLERGNNGQGLL
ncbi:MAG TPA: acetolactate synthase small subunit [Thermodesulfobacteriota bacterium]|nr:acetolactate synthase small subunit [Thermodesulfobacteriota bacterium]